MENKYLFEFRHIIVTLDVIVLCLCGRKGKCVYLKVHLHHNHDS